MDPLKVSLRGRDVTVGDRLNYHVELAHHLHRLDRVNTYGSFYIADLHAA